MAYQKNADNTLTLTIDAVWAERDTDKAFTHLVTIRILNDGKFQYVGNQILESKENEYPVYIPFLSNLLKINFDFHIQSALYKADTSDAILLLMVLQIILPFLTKR